MRSPAMSLSAPHTTLPLRDYQEATIHAVLAAFERGIPRQVVALPTGTGKTVIFAHLIAQRPGRALILVHRDELIPCYFLTRPLFATQQEPHDRKLCGGECPVK